MRLIFYIFLISQFLNFIEVFGEKVKEESSEFNSISWENVKEEESKSLKKIIWENVEEEESKSLKKIIWKSYKNDEFYFGNKKQQQGSITKRTNSSSSEKIFESTKKSVFSITEIEPYLPLNNFLKKGDFQTSVRWKSSFEGGASGGTGQQIPSFVFDYGISESSLMSIYFSEADDDL